MGFNSIWHWLIVLAIVLLLFGTGRVSTLMGDLAKGVKAFKKGMADDDDITASSAPVAPKSIDHSTTPQASSTAPREDSKPRS